RNVFAIGCPSRYLSSAVGWAALGPLAAMAINSSRKSSVVGVGKPLNEWATRSLSEPSGSLNLIAMPRGLASLSVSGTVGTPAKSEKRTVTGTGVDCMWGALVRLAAALLGVNVPVNTTPLACTARLVV